jgi:hypothetical protein
MTSPHSTGGRQMPEGSTKKGQKNGKMVSVSVMLLTLQLMFTLTNWTEKEKGRDKAKDKLRDSVARAAYVMAKDVLEKAPIFRVNRSFDDLTNSVTA